METILIDDSKCLACHSCEIACSVAHSGSKTLYSAITESAVPVGRLHVEQGGRGRGFPLGCRHCQDPQCVRACVTKALYLDPDGAVLHDKTRCIGCFMCFISCPFGSIEKGSKESGACSVTKCDLCIESGREPACVKACPTKALVFADPDNFSKNRRRDYIVEMTTTVLPEYD